MYYKIIKLKNKLSHYLSGEDKKALLTYDELSRMSKLESIEKIEFQKGRCRISLSDNRIFEYNPHVKVSQLYSIPKFGYFEKKETAFIKNIIKKGNVCFDIGGCFGWYTVLLSQLVGAEGKVHVFEPIPDNYQALCENITLNNCNNVITNNMAVDNENGEKDLFVPDIGVSGSFKLHKYKREYSKVTSQTVTLDSYCKDNSINHIDFIKADIEGAELLMLKGGLNIIRSSMPILLLEIQKKSTKLYGYEPGDIFYKVYQLGYKSFIIKNNGQLINYEYSEYLPDYNFIFLPPVQTQ